MTHALRHGIIRRRDGVIRNGPVDMCRLAIQVSVGEMARQAAKINHGETEHPLEAFVVA
jgi:hypothetical protein